MIPASKKLKRKRILFRAKSPLTAIISSILLVAAILVVLIHYGVHEQVLVLLSWVESQGIWAPLIFILIMALVVVLLVPGVMLTTGAGFVFGVVEGSIVVVLGTTMGAALAFLAARYLFSQRTSRFFLKHARIRLLSEELSLHGWKIVLLTRLVPFFPSKISNYFFGLTPFSFRGYVFGSLFGFIPYSVHNVYLGSIAADIATLGQRHQERSPLEWAVYGLGFLATLVAVLYLNRLARRALNRYLAENTEGE